MIMEPFAIYALPVGGGKLGLCPLPGRSGDYAADFKVLKDWQPDLLISLTEASEMSHAGAALLGQDVQAIGSRWLHLPVKDFGTFQRADYPAWNETQHLALGILNAGDRVLVHCKGGCGRSGMIVLRLMIASGEEPEIALKSLRRVRPCAVETDAQQKWAQALR